MDTKVEELERKVAQTGSDLRLVEEALDASVADRKQLHADVDTLCDVLLKLIKKLDSDKKKAGARPTRRLSQRPL